MSCMAIQVPLHLLCNKNLLYCKESFTQQAGGITSATRLIVASLAKIKNDFDFTSGQIIPAHWNYLTEIQFISKAVKLFQVIGII